jgi:hypothetical protein
MGAVVEETGEPAIPGGDTGLLVRRYKSIGYGKNSEKVEEYELDPVLLRERRRIEEQAARELGELGVEAAGKGTGGGGTVVIVVPMGLPVGATPVSRPVQMDIPGRMAPAQLAAAEVVDVGLEDETSEGARGDIEDIEPEDAPIEDTPDLF